MKYLYKIFHKTDPGKFEQIYNKRIRFDSTVLLGLSIKPMDQPHTYPLYYVPTNSMLQMIQTIHVLSASLQETYQHKLPGVAQEQFVRECLVEELFSTNELEGVRSTREEIARSAREVEVNRNSRVRFASMIRIYRDMVNHEVELPRTPEDVRTIYDEITEGEIEPKDRPDGNIFRKDMVHVWKKSGTGKIVHRGILPESEIVAAVEKLLEFLNARDDLPDLVKVAVGHFYFGYIHPFYDGNGRTSRYISSLYLSKVLGRVPSLSLSRGCNKQKNRYLDVFEWTNSIKSRGEMNGFIEAFFEILIGALDEMNAELKEKRHLLELAGQKIESKIPDKEHKNLMFILAQNHFFAHEKGLTVQELAAVAEKSEVTIRKKLRELSDLGFLEQKGERPVYYRLNQQFLET